MENDHNCQGGKICPYVLLSWVPAKERRRTMKRAAKITLGLGVTLFLLGMMTGCRKTEIGYINTNPEKYVGKEVTIEGWAYHNIFEIQEYEKRKAGAEKKYKEKAGLPPLVRGLPPVYVRPEEFNWITSAEGSSPLMATAQANLDRGLGDKKAGMIDAKYEVSPPKSWTKVKVRGIIKLREVYGNLVPIIVVKSWEYIQFQSSKEKTREKYKKHITK